MKQFIVTVENNPDFCGEGAGGAQFAHGEATITNEVLAEWFKSHDGYSVEEFKPAEEVKSAAKSRAAK